MQIVSIGDYVYLGVDDYKAAYTHITKDTIWLHLGNFTLVLSCPAQHRGPIKPKSNLLYYNPPSRRPRDIP